MNNFFKVILQKSELRELSEDLEEIQAFKNLVNLTLCIDTMNSFLIFFRLEGRML